jgi:DNA-3-methyladenine glycosylase
VNFSPADWTMQQTSPEPNTIDFTQEADLVAPQLLGAVLIRGSVAVEITEVEAYLGQRDEASHAYKGPTPRCATMFGPPLRLYVYASYGIHRAGNIVCAPSGVASGVLLRAGRVISGYETVRARRGEKPEDAALARGPGNIGQALGFDLTLNGAEILPRATREHVEASPDSLQLVMRDHVPTTVAGRRIGISKNIEAPLRFWIPNDRTVTSPRRPPASAR